MTFAFLSLSLFLFFMLKVSLHEYAILVLVPFLTFDDDEFRSLLYGEMTQRRESSNTWFIYAGFALVCMVAGVLLAGIG